jgi:hypothetical protein
MDNDIDDNNNIYDSMDVAGYLNASPFTVLQSDRVHWSVADDGHLDGTVVIWGRLYHIDALEVDEHGKAINQNTGAGHIAALWQYNDLAEDESFVSVELIPGHHYVVTIEPGITYEGLSQWADIVALRESEYEKARGTSDEKNIQKLD